MGKFLRENWLWIMAPIVIVLLLFVAVLITSGSEDAGSFIYSIY